MMDTGAGSHRRAVLDPPAQLQRVYRLRQQDFHSLKCRAPSTQGWGARVHLLPGFCDYGMKDRASLGGREAVSSPPVLSLGSPSSDLFVDRRGDSIKNSYLRNYLFIRSPQGLQSWKNIFNLLLVLDVQKNEWYFIAVILYDTVTIP